MFVIIIARRVRELSDDLPKILVSSNTKLLRLGNRDAMPRRQVPFSLYRHLKCRQHLNLQDAFFHRMPKSRPWCNFVGEKGGGGVGGGVRICKHMVDRIQYLQQGNTAITNMLQE